MSPRASPRAAQSEGDMSPLKMPRASLLRLLYFFLFVAVAVHVTVLKIPQAEELQDGETAPVSTSKINQSTSSTSLGKGTTSTSKADISPVLRLHSTSKINQSTSSTSLGKGTTSTSKADISPVLRLQNKLSSGLWVKPAVWLTLLDDSVASDAGATAFKRHVISKNLFGRVSWSEMGVLFTPSSSPDLLTWAKELGIKLHPVSPLSCGPSSTSSETRHSLTILQAWCMPTSKAVVFMDVHTIITRDVRELVGLCSPTNNAAFCGAAAGMDHPAYTIDPNLFVAHPSERHCEALISRAKEILPREKYCSKYLLNDYFTQVNRTLLDSRFLSVQGDARPIHSADDSRVVQYSFKDVTSPPKAAVIDLLARVDRAVASFESQRAGQIPKRVLYAALLTPAPTEGYTHSTTSAVFKQHHVSKFSWGQIPWENQAIIYTEDAFPDFRQWLKDRGGHVIRVPPLLCDKARDKRYRYQFTKLQFWNLTDWDMIVYTDLDTLITGDISNLWSSCPDDYNLCTIDEPRYFERGYTYSSGGVSRRGYTYTNGGVLLVRPDMGFYDFVMEGHETYQNRTLLCEQDFINFFLTNRRYGNVDPKFNTMGFDPKRTTRFQDGKILHFDLRLVNELYEGVTPAERDFVNQIIVKLDKEGAAFPDPALNTTRFNSDTFHDP